MSPSICVFVCLCVCKEREKLTALLRRLIRPVFAVLHIIAHLAAVDALAVLTPELSWPVAFRNCGEHIR